MRIDIATLFTQMCDSVLNESIVGRGIKNGFIEVHTHDIRKYTENKHRRVDDKPYGGGTGMLMQAQPVYDCISAIKSQGEGKPRIIYMSPQGEVLTQQKVKELAQEPWLILLCGHYEGIDQRVLDELEAEELSVGNYVLTGGELPALIVADAVARLQPGVLPNEDAYSIESHYNGLLEFPQYTRPEEWHGRRVPEVLLTGDHRTVTDWQNREALRVTARKRPDMHKKYIDELQKNYWNEFLASKGLDRSVRYKEAMFCRDEESSSKLIKLLLRGKKRAFVSCCERTVTMDSLPKKGTYFAVTDYDKIPRCVVKVTGSQIIRFNEITPEQVLKLGEDKTVEEWTNRNRKIFEHLCKEIGSEFSEDMPIIYVEIRLEYKGTKS